MGVPTSTTSRLLDTGEQVPWSSHWSMMPELIFPSLTSPAMTAKVCLSTETQSHSLSTKKDTPRNPHLVSVPLHLQHQTHVYKVASCSNQHAEHANPCEFVHNIPHVFHCT